MFPHISQLSSKLSSSWLHHSTILQLISVSQGTHVSDEVQSVSQSTNGILSHSYREIRVLKLHRQMNLRFTFFSVKFFSKSSVFSHASCAEYVVCWFESPQMVVMQHLKHLESYSTLYFFSNLQLLQSTKTLILFTDPDALEATPPF